MQKITYYQSQINDWTESVITMGWNLGQKIIGTVRRKKEGIKIVKKSHYGTRYIYGGEEDNKLIYDMLKEGGPLMMCRYGSVELDTLSYFIKHISSPFISFSNGIKHYMSYNAGFFPTDDMSLTRFSSELIDVTRNADVFGVWFLSEEEPVLESYAPYAKIVGEGNLVPFWIQNPWTRYLKGKRVLIIHPFTDSIKAQYKKRELLFADKDVLPEFELITLKAVQSIHDCVEDLPYQNWFEALDDMKCKIQKIDFDIALICAGAYGIFLADFCKRIGKIGIHTGAGLQLMFGIRGKRWDGNGDDSLENKIFNEHWVCPLQSERPKGYKNVEEGCYW